MRDKTCFNIDIIGSKDVHEKQNIQPKDDILK